jgi:hypothetical protein
MISRKTAIATSIRSNSILLFGYKIFSNDLNSLDLPGALTLFFSIFLDFFVHFCIIFKLNIYYKIRFSIKVSFIRILKLFKDDSTFN